MRPAINDYLQLPADEIVVNSVAYQVQHHKPRKWQFWRSENIKYNVLVMTNKGRLFNVDPDNFTIEEKANQ